MKNPAIESAPSHLKYHSKVPDVRFGVGQAPDSHGDKQAYGGEQNEFR